MEEFLKNWSIGTINWVEPVPSYWGKTSLVTTAEQHSFVLKEKSDLLQAEKEFTLLSLLSNVGAPVAVPIRTVDREWYAINNGKIFCLYPKLPGEIITEHYEGNALSRASTFGKAIGFLHTCLLKCDNLNGYTNMKLMEQIRNWAIPRIREHNATVDGDSIVTIWNEIEQEMEPIYDQLPKQLIHRDPHPANMLFDKDKLTGFFDFEMVVRGPRIFDVCYCATSLLVSAFPDTEKMQRWPALFRSILNGYQVACPLSAAELLALYGTLAAIELLFAAFSLETHAEGAARCNAKVLQWLSANRELLLV